LFTSLGLLPLACGKAISLPPCDEGDPALGSAPICAEPAPLDACGESTPVLARDIGWQLAPQLQPVDSGLSRCENSVLHRPESVSCTSLLPRELPPVAPDGSTTTQVAWLYPGLANNPYAGSPTQCAADADCTEKPHGYCAPTVGDQLDWAMCHYGCVADDECGAGSLCACGDPVGQCVPADCRSDQDCNEGLCTAWFSENVCGTSMAFTCQTPDDECNTLADCGGSGSCSPEDGRLQCQPPSGVVCGRPFLVRDSARLASLVSGGDWGTPSIRPAELATPEQQVRVTEHWARAALMEHASIAAFARFTLQLLHLGAPRELIEQSQRAMADESEHARLCFGLAQRYLGAPLGPGALPMDDALLDLSFERVLVLCFREGCVGETVAAIEAQVARDQASDPEVQRALDRIGPDELRHAELAWKFVDWALREKPELTRALLREELHTLSAELARTASTGPTHGADPESLAHGVLPEPERARVRRSALSEVVLPCAEALLHTALQGSIAPVFSGVRQPPSGHSWPA